MYELLPILAGGLAGATAAELGTRTARVALVVSVALASALGAGVASGELAESWAFVLWDTAQACAVAILVIFAAPALRRVKGRARG